MHYSYTEQFVRLPCVNLILFQCLTSLQTNQLLDSLRVVRSLSVVRSLRIVCRQIVSNNCHCSYRLANLANVTVRPQNYDIIWWILFRKSNIAYSALYWENSKTKLFQYV